MPKFPEPPQPADLASLGADVRRLAAGTELTRLYFRGGRHPTLWDTFRAFGPVESRFDHHLPPPRVQSRRILYAAQHGPTALAEVFQHARVVDRNRYDPWLVIFRLGQAVDLLDLTGTWPTRAGASMALSSGARPRARRWSRAIYEAYPQVQGLLYPSSMYAHKPAVALYERALPAMSRRPTFHRPLTDPALIGMLKQVTLEVGYAVF